MTRLQPRRTATYAAIVATSIAIAIYLFWPGQNSPSTRAESSLPLAPHAVASSAEPTRSNEAPNAIVEKPRVDNKVAAISTRMTIAQEFASASDLKAFFDKYQTNWTSASGEVKYYLGKTLTYCAQFIGSAYDKYPRLPVIPAAARNQPNYAQRQAAYERMQKECRGFESFQLPEGLGAELRASAAESGYAGAKAEALVDLQRSGKSQEARALAEALLRGPINDEVANGLVNYLGSQIADIRVGNPPYQPRADLYVDAWRWVMCDVGMDCSVHSQALNLLCVYRGSCGAASYEDYLQSQQYSPANFEEISRIRQQLLEGLRQRDLTLLGLSK